MQYRTLGHGGLSISEISFGCMSLQVDNKSATYLIHQAMDTGINFFDTADLYEKGLNEALVGAALAGKRNTIFIGTKVGNEWLDDGSNWRWNPSKKYIIAATEKSLKRLQTDYIDLLQLHGGTIQDAIPETIAAFEQLKQEGKIRQYGISSIRPNVIREYVRLSNITSVMMQYSLLDRRPEEECLNYLQQHNIGVLVRGSLAKGLLTGKEAAPYNGFPGDTVRLAATAIKETSSADREKSQTAIRFVLQHPAVTSAVVGIRTAQQLEEASRAPSTPELTSKEYQLLQEAVPASVYKEHR